MIFNSLWKNYIVNIVGTLLPLGISLATVPVYIHHIGDARYGILSIVWVLLGYFGFLDLGLSRAAANALARLSRAPQELRAKVLVTTLALNLALGVFGSLILAALGNILIERVLNIPEVLKPEIVAAFPWIVGLFPLALVSGVGLGALESRENFVRANILQVIGTSLGQIIPMALAVEFSPSLSIVVPAAALARGLTVAAILVSVYKLEGPLRLQHFDRNQITPLLRYGGWVSVSGVISPVLTSLDQFVIGSTLGVAAVAHYSVPMNLVMRSQVIAAALERTVFPRLSHLTLEDANRLARTAAVNLASAFASVICPAVFLLKPFMLLWLGASFVENSEGIGQILLIGAWINGLAFVAGGLIQARGRPKLTASFHCAEILPFVALLWWLASHWGLTGVAIAWVLRVTVDTALMYAFSGFLDRDLLLRIALLFAVMILAVLVERMINVDLAARLGLAMMFAIPGLIFDYFSRESLIRRFTAAGGSARLMPPIS